jgi:molybdate transport system substrate-binding protein
VRAFLAISVGILLLAGCATQRPTPTEVVILAAASLGTALDQLSSEYMTSHASGRTFLTISTGSSTALRTQIEQGAPADLFLSADSTNPQMLFDAGLTDGPPVPFATNRLAIVVPLGNPARIESAAGLARNGIRVIAAGEDVPITKYAEQAIAKLAALPGSPPRFAEAYEANIVSREDNVGAVVAKIQLGEGDAAIVYVTDALAAELDRVDIPPEANVRATYAGVVVRSSNYAVAHSVLDWILGPEAQNTLADLGFSPAP